MKCTHSNIKQIKVCSLSLLIKSFSYMMDLGRRANTLGLCMLTPSTSKLYS